uniref:Uncharacterized protein LOC105080204 isoform X1 n=2 Tax=Camelus bactrianus TaxID=9837 RepID=A0A9W3H8M3_CAMBA|nr:uncharacterized protein LOC105080204 isoform X1 [Camelus bactrianus]
MFCRMPGDPDPHRPVHLHSGLSLLRGPRMSAGGSVSRRSLQPIVAVLLFSRALSPHARQVDVKLRPEPLGTGGRPPTLWRAASSLRPAAQRLTLLTHLLGRSRGDAHQPSGRPVARGADTYQQPLPACSARAWRPVGPPHSWTPCRRCVTDVRQPLVPLGPQDSRCWAVLSVGERQGGARACATCGGDRGSGRTDEHDCSPSSSGSL